jgi:allophanate hydrolase subunit 2
LAGRALRAGDRLPLPIVADPVSRSGWHLPAAAGPLDARVPVRVLPGPHLEQFFFATGAFDQFCEVAWRIGDQADRMGYRLQGPTLQHTRGAGVASLGLPLGAVQVPGDGQPIVLLADHQPTGGYTVLACVIRADLGLLAQRAPGDSVSFAPVSAAEAHAALCSRYASLQTLMSDAATWAGLRLAESGSQVLAA